LPATDVVRGYALDTLDLAEQSPPVESEGARERGAKMADTVYGYGLGTRLAQRESGNLFNDETIEQLFANIWTRPGLSVRDRRLLVIGATAAIGGRPDLIKIQALGGLENKEFTPEQ
jgi:alkylhydroperoxidase/carboxymuconolactone decarboxylase family protein YurZ